MEFLVSALEQSLRLWEQFWLIKSYQTQFLLRTNGKPKYPFIGPLRNYKKLRQYLMHYAFP